MAKQIFVYIIKIDNLLNLYKFIFYYINFKLIFIYLINTKK